ncbi:hypothetical protein HDU82_007785 [Entophlyctis luteolus]|nr:hypothetical protein HDU82_007785 [Entophlyctis luteolus]
MDGMQLRVVAGDIVAILPARDSSSTATGADAPRDDSGVADLPEWLAQLIAKTGSGALDVETSTVSVASARLAREVVLRKVTDEVYFPTSSGIARVKASSSPEVEYTTWISELSSDSLGTVVENGSVFASTIHRTIVFCVEHVHSDIVGNCNLFVIGESTEVTVAHDWKPASPIFTPYEKHAQKLKDAAESRMFRSELHDHVGIPPPLTALISGPPGVGKTFLVKCEQLVFDHLQGLTKQNLNRTLQRELSVPLYSVSILEIAEYMKTSAKNGDGRSSRCPLRTAINRARCSAPAIVVIDDIHLLARRIDATNSLSEALPIEAADVGELIAREVAALRACGSHAGVFVVLECGGRNGVDGLPPAITNGMAHVGLDASAVCEVSVKMEMPSRSDREQISLLILSELNVTVDQSEEAFSEKIIAGEDTLIKLYARRLAQATPGYVARDLKNVIARAQMSAKLRHRRSLKNKQSVSNKDSAVSWSLDFAKACAYVQASGVVYSGFDVGKDSLSLDDIGGYKSVKAKLTSLIINPYYKPAAYERLNVKPPSGVLLYGPSGCGKSLLARTIASTSPMNFIAVNGSKIFSKYLGESEATVRQIFAIARKTAPTIIFFDNIENIATRREMVSDNDDSASSVNTRILATLLNEMDGVSSTVGAVLVVGATSKPEKLDDAILRPGRLSHHVYVGMPTLDDRVAVLDAILRKRSRENAPVPEELSHLAARLDTARVASVTDGFTCADLDSLIREAGYLWLRESATDGSVNDIGWKHVSAALTGALKGPVEDVFRKAFEDTNDEDASEKDFWKSFSYSGTWSVGPFQQSMAELEEVRKILLLRKGGDDVPGGGWWRPGSCSRDDLNRFEVFAMGKKATNNF